MRGWMACPLINSSTKYKEIYTMRQRRKGATETVLGWVRKDDFYSNDRGAVHARMKPNKPTGRRKIVRGAVRPDGTWGVVPA